MGRALRRHVPGRPPPLPKGLESEASPRFQMESPPGKDAPCPCLASPSPPVTAAIKGCDSPAGGARGWEWGWESGPASEVWSGVGRRCTGAVATSFSPPHTLCRE